MQPTQEDYLQDFIDFVNTVADSTPGRKINHGGSWCSCAIGDWVHARLGDRTIAENDFIVNEDFERSVGKIVLPQALLNVLNIPRVAAAEAPTYSDLTKLLDPYDARY